MSKTVDALRRAEEARIQGGADPAWDRERDFRVVTITSNKGGVGKTTVAANLAVYLRALDEDAPVLIFGFDDQTTLDRIFNLGSREGAGDLADGLREQNFRRVARFGQYGVDHVLSSEDVPMLRGLLPGPDALKRILLASDRSGTVVIDTKSDFEILTRSAITASDLTVVVVKDQASLIEARKVFDLLDKAGRPRTAARVLLSLVDMRVKYREDEDSDVLAHLLSEIRREGYPVFETFLSRSPKVESLYTNPAGRALAILQGARQSTVHRQMLHLTREVVRELDAARPMSVAATRVDAVAERDRPDVQAPVPAAAERDRPNVEAPVPTAAEPSVRKGPRFWGGMLPRRDA